MPAVSAHSLTTKLIKNSEKIMLSTLKKLKKNYRVSGRK